MVKIDDAFELRYKKDKEQFEVLVDFDKLKEFQKKPEEVNVYDVLADDKIFKDQKKGEIASENILKEIFKNLGEEEILKEILLKGECQIPTAYLNKLREEKKVQVINFVAENALNAQTKGKYTPTMIESEINKLKFNFDPHKSFELQAEDVLNLLRKVMPISIEKVIIQMSIPPQYTGAFYGNFRKFGKVLREFYDNDANLKMEMEITESQTDKIIDYIKSNTSEEGSYYVKKE